MGVLDQIKDMEDKGFSEQQIINKLKEQEGISPKEINDALSRSKIKNAVSDTNQNVVEKNMQPSIMSPEKELGSDKNYGLESPIPSLDYQRKFTSKTKEISQEQGPPVPAPIQNPPQGFQESYNPVQQYPNYPSAPMAMGDEYADYDMGEGYAPDTDMMIEISEQVFSEKMKPLLKQIEENVEFKTLSETKIENISHRLTRIESQIDNLQSAILEKVGGYGRGLEGVKKEMSMVQDSFGKIVNDLADKHSKRTHTTHKVTHKAGKKKSSRKK